MTQQGRANREKPEGVGKSHHKARLQPPLHDQLKAENEGVTEALLKSSPDTHAALLADAPSDRHRANLVLGLQQSHGNTYVQRLLSSQVVQAKLTVNPPGDEYEREADRVAEAITQTSLSQVQRQEEEEEEIQTKTSQVQRQEEEEEELQMKASDIQRQPIEEEEELQMKASDIQRQPIEEEEEELMMKPSQIQRVPAPPATGVLEEEEEEIQTKSDGSQPPLVSESLEGQINDARSSGQPLDNVVRASLEPHFQSDFGQVRVHTDGEADRLSRKLGAEAFTTGPDIFFRAGTYQPHTESGRGLIAHELTHVVQQSGAPILQRDAVEQETATESTTDRPAAGDVLTGAQASLWRTLVVVPLTEAHREAMRESPDWGLIADRCATVHTSIQNFTEAMSVPEAVRFHIETIGSQVFSCHLTAASHATGGEGLLSLLVNAKDYSERLATAS